MARNKESVAPVPSPANDKGPFKWTYDKAESYVLTFDRQAVALLAESANMKPEGMEYVIAYGLKQSMDDVIAGKAAQLKGTASAGNWDDKDRDAKAVELGLVGADGKPAYTIAQLSELYVAALWAERWKGILNGTLESRKVGPKLTGLAAITRDVTEFMFTNAFARMNLNRDKAGQKRLPMPEKDALKDALKGYYESHKAKVDAEAQRQFADTTNDESDDETALLALVTAKVTPMPETPAA